MEGEGSVKEGEFGAADSRSLILAENKPMVKAFRKRFLVLSAASLLAGTLVLALLVRPKMGLAFAITFSLVAADFLWMSFGLGRVLGGGEIKTGSQTLFYLGIVLRTGLLLLALYGTLKLLPQESLGVILGIGGQLVLLALAGTAPARG